MVSPPLKLAELTPTGDCTSLTLNIHPSGFGASMSSMLVTNSPQVLASLVNVNLFSAFALFMRSKTTLSSFSG